MKSFVSLTRVGTEVLFYCDLVVLAWSLSNLCRKQHVHHPLVYGPLYSVDEEGSETADTQAAEEDR